MKKIKTLIIEDEVLARTGLHMLINWEEKGFEMLPDARDCLEAKELIEAQNPDLLLLDINTPGMNGIELLNWLRAEGRTPIVIVISCLEDFETTKKALQLGAFDYIRKLNLTKEELELSLERATAKIRNDGEHFEDSTADIEYVLQNDDFSGTEYIRKLGHTFDTGFCFAVSLARKESIFQNQISECSCAVRKALAEHNIPFATFTRNNYLVVLCATDKADAPATVFGGSLSEVCRKFYIGVSDFWLTPQDIKLKIRLALQIENDAFYRFPNKTVYYSNVVANNYNYSAWFMPMYEGIRNSLNSFDFQEIEKNLNSVFKRIKDDGSLSIGAVRRITMDLLSEFSMSAVSLGGSIDEVAIGEEEANRNYKTLMTCDDINELQETFTSFMYRYKETFLLRQKIQKSTIIKDIVTYINNNLCSQITLKDISKEINVSEAYLSSYFKKEMSENLISFVNRTKIERAKEMMGENLLINRISDSLGYSDAAYFSKVFRKYTGVSPDTYKRIMPGKR